MLAQIVEEVSVLSSDHRRKKPRAIPRPGRKTAAAGSNVISMEHAKNVLLQTRRGVRGG